MDGIKEVNEIMGRGKYRIFAIRAFDSVVEIGTVLENSVEAYDDEIVGEYDGTCVFGPIEWDGDAATNLGELIALANEYYAGSGIITLVGADQYGDAVPPEDGSCVLVEPTVLAILS